MLRGSSVLKEISEVAQLFLLVKIAGRLDVTTRLS
jgi:hypothetical protein